MPLGSLLGVAEGDVEDSEDAEDEDDDVEGTDVEDTDVEDIDVEEAVVLEATSALVMLKRSVAESVTLAPAAHTAIAKTGEAERSLRVPTSHGKLVAPTWSSATVSGAR